MDGESGLVMMIPEPSCEPSNPVPFSAPQGSPPLRRPMEAVDIDQCFWTRIWGSALDPQAEKLRSLPSSEQVKIRRA